MFYKLINLNIRDGNASDVLVEAPNRRRAVLYMQQIGGTQVLSPFITQDPEIPPAAYCGDTRQVFVGELTDPDAGWVRLWRKR